MSPEDLDLIMTHAFTVPSECGRTWEVPMRAVLNDYLRFRRDNDGHDRAQVMAPLTADDVSTWFFEQYDWSDVERDGRLVASPTPQQIQQALDLMRGSSPASSRAECGPSAHETARVNRRRLSHGLPSSASKRRAKPKM